MGIEVLFFTVAFVCALMIIGIILDERALTKIDKGLDFVLEHGYRFFGDYLLLSKRLKKNRESSLLILLAVMVLLFFIFSKTEIIHYDELHFSLRWFIWYIFIVCLLYLGKFIIDFWISRKKGE